MITLREADGDELGVVRELFQEYADELGVDLCFQGFHEEMENLPWLYARPKGFIYLARQETGLAGCIALKPLSEDTCEMKRLYVRPKHRGHGIAQELALACLQEAIKIGYSTMKLDTLERMVPAISLYTKLGFEKCDPYYANPLAEVVYMQKRLNRPSNGQD
ncbi:MAG TPA: GNAT family N-acetyltransferase [Fimbriimonadaceae bacterium]